MKHSLFAAFASLLLLSGAARAEIATDTIKIGVLTDMSGVYADASGAGAVEAVKMAVADFGGALNGKKIEIVSADHQNKPDIATSIARKWFDEDGVDMITDLTTSSVALAVQEIARARNKVILISGAASSDLTGKSCAPTSVHWTYDTLALANGTGSAIVKSGGNTWFFITVDYAFGHALERDTANIVKENGGKVLGQVRHPLNTSDFSSYLLQAQASGAKVIGLANAGNDTVNAIKQAAEFGIVTGGQKLASLLIFLTDVHSIGLKTANGLELTSPFYWDQDDQTRAFSKRFADKVGRPPTMIQAGDYSATTHWLDAIKAANTLDAPTVMKELRSHPINDFMTKNGQIKEDGTLVRDMYLFEVKKPEEAKGDWDLYKQIRMIPGEEAYKRPGGNECPLVKG